jgi:copper homeostasis protein
VIQLDKKVLVEVCCGSVDDAIEAERAGADRIELNSSLFFGGLTPSIGSIIETKKSVKIPVIVMIRPRGGGFCYTESEFKAMQYDTIEAIKAGADGIAFGVLNEDGTVDVERCKKIVELIGDKEAIFHRAFDVTPDPFKAVDTLIDIGINRILTKGQENTLEAGIHLLKKLFDYSGDRIEILPSGCKAYNVDWAIRELKCSQIHVASYISKIDTSGAARPNVYFGSALRPSEGSYELVNSSFVKTIIDKIQ